MADVNKTIDIQIKADMKEMLRTLKKMPNMAGDEAKKMVNQLKRQFQRAEIAAKAQAKAHARANQQMANSTKRTTNSMVRDMDRQIKKSKSARVQSREMGAALGSLEDVVGALSPELAGLAGVAGTLGSAFRTLARSMATGNPIVLTLIASVAAAATAYTVFTASARENEDSQKKLSEAIQKTNEEVQLSKKAFQEAENAMLDNAGKVNELRTQYQLLTGQITAAELAEMEREVQASKFADKAQEDFEKQRRALFQQEAAQNRALAQLKEREETLKRTNRFFDREYKLTAAGRDIRKEEERIQKKLSEINRKQSELKVEGQKRVNSTSEEYLEILEKIAIENKRQEDAEKALARAQAIRTKNQKAAATAGKSIGITLTKTLKEEESKLNEIQKIGSDAKNDADKLAIMNERLRISLMDTSLMKINEEIHLEKSILESKIASLEAIKKETMAQANSATQIIEAKKANQEIDKQIAEEREAFALKEQKLSEKAFQEAENAMLEP